MRADAANGAGFEGRLYQPGARIAVDELVDPAVVLEHAGPQGTWRQRNRAQRRDHLWVLWAWDTGSGDTGSGHWREIARASAPDASWAVTLREPAIRALRPVAASAAPDPILRGREVTDALLEHLDRALTLELPSVRMAVLCSIYDRVAGRIVAA